MQVEEFLLSYLQRLDCGDAFILVAAHLLAKSTSDLLGVNHTARSDYTILDER